MSHQSDLIEKDINAYLAQHEQKELLRFLTCGSVDDGKSTLIGRLLHDSKMIYEDQLASIQADTVKHGTTGEKIDLALLVDGLQAEREQGITIDVAYRYFSTAQRKFIIADTPGHEQYTRNMATGASTCDLAIILIDSRYGVVTQTRRHSYIASLLGIKHIIVAVNKMDLVDFDQKTFEKIKADYLSFSENLEQQDYFFVPLSALDGDNVVNKSVRSDWYDGPSLMEILETVEISADKNITDFRYPVQYVNRPNLNFRGFCGTVASGEVHIGDSVRVLPSGKTSQVSDIVVHGDQLEHAFIGQSVTLLLEDEIDISRGDVIVKSDDAISISNLIKAHFVWMADTQLTIGEHYLFKFNSKSIRGVVRSIDYRIDINHLEHLVADSLQLNDIAVVEIELEESVVVDQYRENRSTGAFIVIDHLSNATVGSGMVIDSKHEESILSLSTMPASVSAFEIELNQLIRKHFPHWQAKDIKTVLEKEKKK